MLVICFIDSSKTKSTRSEAESREAGELRVRMTVRKSFVFIVVRFYQFIVFMLVICGNWFGMKSARSEEESRKAGGKKLMIK